MRVRIPRLGLSRLERGATAVLVAVTATALLGMAAVSVDYASASNKKAEVQAAADAAALEIARDCFKSETNCQTNAENKADWYADEIGAEVTAVQVDPTADTVRVQLSSDTETLFAKAAFGDDEADGEVTSGAVARAKYERGTVTEYAPMYPLAFEYCAFRAAGASDKWYELGSIPLTKTSAPPAGCTDPRDNVTRNMDGPHNQAALMTDDFFGLSSKCEFEKNKALSVWQHYADTVFNTIVKIDLGCQDKFLKLKPGDTILVPIYASYKQKIGSIHVAQNPSLRIVGFAPFKLASGKAFKYRVLFFDVETNECKLGVQAIGGLIGLGCNHIKGKFIETKEVFPDAVYGTEVDGVDAPVLGALGAVVNLIL